MLVLTVWKTWNVPLSGIYIRNFWCQSHRFGSFWILFWTASFSVSFVIHFKKRWRVAIGSGAPATPLQDTLYPVMIFLFFLFFLCWNTKRDAAAFDGLASDTLTESVFPFPLISILSSIIPLFTTSDRVTQWTGVTEVLGAMDFPLSSVPSAGGARFPSILVVVIATSAQVFWWILEGSSISFFRLLFSVKYLSTTLVIAETLLFQHVKSLIHHVLLILGIHNISETYWIYAELNVSWPSLIFQLSRASIWVSASISREWASFAWSFGRIFLLLQFAKGIFCAP